LAVVQLFTLDGMTRITNMKTIIHKLIVVVVCIFASQVAFGQQDIPDNAGGLTASADAYFFTLEIQGCISDLHF
jgi:hypothetical protein